MKARFLVPIVCLGLLAAGCGDKAQSTDASTNTTGGTGSEQTTKKPAVPLGTLKELKIEDQEVGKGPTAETGDLVAVLYKGTLADGALFDSNMEGGAPLAFRLGTGFVIKGWDEGVVGMKVGGTRKISIPASLAYGDQGSPPKVPPKADLYFDVKLLDVVKKGEEQIYDKTDVKLGTGPQAKAGDKVTVEYEGTLANGDVFDSSRGRGTPFTFTLGANDVVPGFDAGITGMRVGGVRKLRLPPEVAYGGRGNPPSIPPDATLLFTIEMLKIQPGG
ncbi:MAG: FKBP-type peptidyl-prolyl cis-trans isomerase [Fimbriimonadaceae bacterium]|nr:FKBP-type peptidyl-prolyl cis-trans isomerase [Fimbriimonadaceae bacterium]